MCVRVCSAHEGLTQHTDRSFLFWFPEKRASVPGRAYSHSLVTFSESPSKQKGDKREVKQVGVCFACARSSHLVYEFLCVCLVWVCVWCGCLVWVFAKFMHLYRPMEGSIVPAVSRHFIVCLHDLILNSVKPFPNQHAAPLLSPPSFYNPTPTHTHTHTPLPASSLDTHLISSQIHILSGQ